MASIFQLTYISTAREGVGLPECQDILEEARAGNALNGVTGLLLFNSRRFVQVLEGEEQAVRATYALIEQDPRHFGLVVVGEEYVEAHQFGQWAMAFDDGTGSEKDLSAKVDAMLDKAGPSTRALFQTSAKLYRRPTPLMD
jgi:hypothetical protein